MGMPPLRRVEPQHALHLQEMRAARVKRAALVPEEHQERSPGTGASNAERCRWVRRFQLLY
jgi:hypothetical protein